MSAPDFIVPLDVNDKGGVDVRLALAGDVFRLRVTYNASDDSWWLSLFDEDDAPLRRSIRMVAGLPLLLDLVDPRRPKGELVIVDSVSPSRDPIAGDLGTRHTLYFVPFAVA